MLTASGANSVAALLDPAQRLVDVAQPLLGARNQARMRLDVSGGARSIHLVTRRQLGIIRLLMSELINPLIGLVAQRH